MLFRRFRQIITIIFSKSASDFSVLPEKAEWAVVWPIIVVSHATYRLVSLSIHFNSSVSIKKHLSTRLQINCQVHYVISETVVFAGFEEDHNKRIIRILYRGQSSSDYSLLVVPRGVNVSRFAWSCVLRAAQPCSDRKAPPEPYALSGPPPQGTLFQKLKRARRKVCLFSVLVVPRGVEPLIPAWEASVLTTWPGHRV